MSSLALIMANNRRQATDQDQALSMLERTAEPLFIPKTENNIVFDVPAEYLDEKYRPLASSLKTRFGGQGTTQVAVRQISVPDISELLTLPRRANFSLFIPFHRRLATRLVNIFLGMRTKEDFFSVAAYCRDRINPGLFVYGFSVAILHRPDTRNISLPPLSEIFPDKFVDGAVFDQAREQANILTEQGARTPIEIPQDYTASNLEVEHRVAYFREDLGINLHHWHWHLVYPFNGPREIANKDRRGELFYYMHQQIIARYDFERMSNNLPRVKRLTNLFAPIEEAYFPKLDSLVASRSWAPRHSNATLSDIDREVDQLKFDLQDLVRWRDRIFDAIHKGRIELPDGTTQRLDETRGIDILGNMIEASVLTPNTALYGDLHNFGHVAIALSHDPDQRHLETFGVMGDSATAMRDPVFYRWHAFINDIFVEHKNTLPRYTTQQLEFQGIRVASVEIVTPSAERNSFQTFWQRNDVDLSRGMDFAPRGSVFARFTHLQHSPFQYRINVENNSNGPRQGTVRVFLAPKFDERNQPWQLIDQKNLFIELDRFVVNFKNSPKVTNITRNSAQSTITIPFERTFRDLEANRPQQAGAALNQFNFCGCGWPQHMLIPKGNAEGLPCVLFVMVSNFADDRVESSGQSGPCSDAASFCGVRDQLYPDKRAMGYPFDRLPRLGVNTLAQFLTPNMAATDVRIRFTNRVQEPQGANNNAIAG